MTSFNRAKNSPSPGSVPSRTLARAEREADHVADAVLGGAGAAHRPHAEVPQTGTATVPGVGRPLDPARRAFFQRRLGADLSSVRVHEGAAADRAARDEHAHAYTVGEHVVLGSDIDHDADHTVLAHELVHVLQQRGAGRTAVQRQERTTNTGIGRTPPPVPHDVVTDPPPGEDARVLFPHDSVTFATADLEKLLERLPANRRLIIDIDGYASTEGDTNYNINLSAHRAAVLQAILVRLLPDAEVRIHAHGATAAFGDQAANRRVGIRFTEAPVPLVPPLATGLGKPDRYPRLLPERLHLDPGLFPPGTFPPGAGVPTTDRTVGEPGRSEPATPPQLFPTRVPDLPPSVVERPVDLFPWLVPPTKPVTEWGDLRQIYTNHGFGGPIDPGTAEMLDAHIRRWTRILQEEGGMSEENARTWANRAARNMVDRELTNLGNTIIDQSNNDIARGGGTVFVPTVDVVPYVPYVKKGLEKMRDLFRGKR